jgi:hypothetical protein
MASMRKSYNEDAASMFVTVVAHPRHDVEVGGAPPIAVQPSSHHATMVVVAFGVRGPAQV